MNWEAVNKIYYIFKYIIYIEIIKEKVFRNEDFIILGIFIFERVKG